MADHDDGINRRHALECMIWAGTGVLWTRVGRRAEIARVCSATRKPPSEAPPASPSCRSSDSHVGFDKPANPNALATLKEAIGKVERDAAASPPS